MEQKARTSHSTTTLPTAQQQRFVATLTSLTWQLMLVVLVPTIGGHFADQAARTTPRWTVVGLIVAVLVAGVCIYNGYRIVTAQARKESRNE